MISDRLVIASSEAKLNKSAFIKRPRGSSHVIEEEVIGVFGRLSICILVTEPYIIGDILTCRPVHLNSVRYQNGMRNLPGLEVALFIN